jgi:hypothetical protein
MHNTKVSIVVTSIFHPNKSLLALAEGAKKNNWKFVIAGDVSSPKDFQLKDAEFYDINAQRSLHWKFAALCPERHYTRKNIGYLIAMANGSNVIVETDDDNIPRPEFWTPRQKSITANKITGSGWANIYSLFTKVNVWPRGFPLEELHGSETGTSVIKTPSEIYCPIQQGLADENPDVDAVFRMTQKLPIVFDKKGNYFLEKGLWCPFNSQNTTWFKDAFPLLYLPSFCSFRMTDIWRSFVAQRIMWECDWRLLFHNATVWQERNEHSLIRDFEQEVPGYINNNKIKRLLDALELKGGKDQIGDNMLMCYEELIRNNIISDSKELNLLIAWLEDIQLIGANDRTDC